MGKIDKSFHQENEDVVIDPRKLTESDLGFYERGWKAFLKQIESV